MAAFYYWMDFAIVPAYAGALLYAASPLDAVAASALVIGYVAWVLFEYALHRWGFHGRRSPFFRPHVVHHKHPFDPDGAPMPGVSIIALSVVALLAMWGLGSHIGAAASCGFYVGYVSYIVTHHAIHAGWLTGPIARRHDLHHRGWHLNFNLLCPLGDLMFGTYRR